MQGKLDKAIQHSKLALQFNPDLVKARYNLGIALVKSGKVNEAIYHLQQAVNLAVAQGNLSFAESIRRTLDSFQSTCTQRKTP